MTSEASTSIVIVLVAISAFATRVFGPVLMARIGTSPVIERFLNGLSVSVLVAFVASLSVQSGARGMAAIAITTISMLATRSPVWSMIMGMLAAALWTYLAR